MSKFSYLAKSFIIPAAANDGEVFDVEADNLLDAATAVHCIVIANVNGDKITEYGPQQIPAALNHLDRATRLIGHNISGYDLPLLEKLYGWRPKPGCVVLDTLIASRLILPHIGRLDDQAAGMGDPKLRELRGRHSLDAWAMRLDGRPKPGADIENFAEWSPELQERCVGDVMLTKKLFHFLQPTGYSSQALALEHSTAAVCDWISSAGVLFDITAAEQLGRRWEQRCTELAVAQLARVPELGKLTRPRLIAALLERGWAPEELTDNGNPSLKNNVLEGIAIAYPEFRDAAEYFALSWLLGNMTRGPSSWARHAQTDGRIHAKLLHIGQPHGRASCVSPNLHGVPSPKKGAKFGTECRTLFHAPDDWAMVAADMSNLQDRALAHYLAADGHNEHAQRYLSGEDMHWATTQALGLVDADAVRDKENPVHTALREGMKKFRYAFLFGGQAGRLGHIIFETARAVHNTNPDLMQRFFGSSSPGKAVIKRVGAKALEQFLAATPGLRELRENIAAQVSRGWTEGLDGRRIPLLAQHTSLNYLLVAAEVVVTKRWLVQVRNELDAKFGKNANIVLWTHDEIVVTCRPEIAEQVGEILVRHAKEAGEHFGLRVPLDAEAKIGRDWAGTPIEAGSMAPAPWETESAAAAPKDAGDKYSSAGDGQDHPDDEPDRDDGSDNADFDDRVDDICADDGGDNPSPGVGNRAGIGMISGTVVEPDAPVAGGVTAEHLMRYFENLAPSAGEVGNGAGNDRDAGGGNGKWGDYHNHESEKKADKPYDPVRAALYARGYRVAQTFPFTVPGETTPRFYEDRFELQPGITPSQERPHKTSRFWHQIGEQKLCDTGPRRIIYNWPAILAAGRGATVFITEGANKSKPLNDKGLLATAALYHQWGAECVDALAGYHLIYLAGHCNPLPGWDAHDNDPAARYAADAKNKLAARAASFRIVPAAHLWKYLPPGTRPIRLGDDVKDWLELGGDAAKLLEICQEISVEGNGPLLWHGEPDLRPRHKWRIKQLMPKVGAGLLSGQWGAFKTFMAIELATTVITSDQQFCGRKLVEPCGVLFLVTEGAL